MQSKAKSKSASAAHAMLVDKAHFDVRADVEIFASKRGLRSVLLGQNMRCSGMFYHTCNPSHMTSFPVCASATHAMTVARAHPRVTTTQKASKVKIFAFGKDSDLCCRGEGAPNRQKRVEP